jgi:hypothetical protein
MGSVKNIHASAMLLKINRDVAYNFMMLVMPDKRS